MAIRYHINTANYVVVGEVRPEQTFAPGHEVWNFCNGIRKELQINTKLSAPPFLSKAKWPREGTGNMNRHIKARMDRVGPESIDMVVESLVPYTMFVHGGTAFKKGGNFIYSKAGFANKATVDALAESGFHAAFPGRGIPKNLLPLFMALPPGAGFHERLHLRVHGQSANPFLYRGFNLTALDHECLGGQFTGIVGLGSLQ